MTRRTVLRGAAVLATAGPIGALSAGCSPGSALRASGANRLSMLALGPTAATMSYLSRTALPAFTAATGVRVSLQQSDWGTGFTKVVTAAATGTLPDVVMLGGIWVAPLAAKGALLPIDDLIADDSDRQNFYPAALADCRYRGTTYALPLYSDVRAPLYRKSVLQKAGADVSRLPTTWAEYLDLAQLVHRRGGISTPVDWGIDKSVGLQQSYAQLITQAGGKYFDGAGRAVFDSDAGARAAEYLRGYYHDGLSSPSMVNTGTGPTPFVAGRAAMSFGGLGAVTNALQNEPDVVSDLVAGRPLAASTADRPVTCAWINKLGVSARTANRAGAWRLLQYLCGKEVAARLGELYGGLPARTDILDTKFLTSLPPGLVGASQYAVAQQASPNMLAIAPQINTFLQQLIRQQGSVSAVLSGLDKKIDQINGV